MVRQDRTPAAFSSTAHFLELSRLLLRIEVTDGQGRALSLDEGTERSVALLREVKAASGKAMLIGNGGSAAIVSHMHNDLCKAVGVRALVFNEAPLLTALSNDEGYEQVFERPVGLWAAEGDLLVAVSSSGRSENILRAVRAAAGKGCRVVTLSGFNADNALRHTGDLNFYVPSDTYGSVEVVHTALAHFLTDCAQVPGLDTGEMP